MLRWRYERALVLALWVMLPTPLAQACPDCTAGRAARAALWSEDLAAHLATALAPFAVVALVSLYADRVGRASARRPGGGQ